MDVSVSVVIRAFYVILFIYIGSKIVKWLVDYIKRVYYINKIPTPLTMLPFLGNAHQLKPGAEFFQQCNGFIETHKGKTHIQRIWIGTQPMILSYKAEVVEYLVNSSKHIDKSKEYNFLHPWLRTGLLTSTGDKWATRRRLLTPSFHFEILNDFLVVMNEQADIFVDNLTKKAKSKEKFDIFPMISNCALDIICETAMGQNVNAQKDNKSPYVTAVIKISECVFARMKYPWLGFDLIFKNSSIGKEHDKCLKTIKDFTRKVIMERSKDFDETFSNSSHPKRIAFLDTLLKCKKEDDTLTFDDIQEEVDTFMFEGHDTTAAAAGWASYLIGSHPEVQKKIHDELDRVFGNSNRHITPDDLRELKYLECVIKETLRMYPSVAMFGRSLTEDAVSDKYFIPKGSTVLIFAYQIHRDETYFPNPDKFQPERFLNETATVRHPFAYIPFSAGKRNCIGQKFALMEEKVMLASILRKFKIKALQKAEEMIADFELILRPHNGVIVELEQRE